LVFGFRVAGVEPDGLLEALFRFFQRATSDVQAGQIVPANRGAGLEWQGCAELTLPIGSLAWFRGREAETQIRAHAAVAQLQNLFQMELGFGQLSQGSAGQPQIKMEVCLAGI
jgi:hypothetical protein